MFEQMEKNKLNFSQDAKIEGDDNIVITPHKAGHMIGGTVWKITYNSESIIYAVDFNHRSDMHLNGFGWDQSIFFYWRLL